MPTVGLAAADASILYNVKKEAPPMNSSTNSQDKHKQQVQVLSRSREMAMWQGSRKHEHVTKVKSQDSVTVSISASSQSHCLPWPHPDQKIVWTRSLGSKSECHNFNLLYQHDQNNITKTDTSSKCPKQHHIKQILKTTPHKQIHQLTQQQWNTKKGNSAKSFFNRYPETI